jgi:nucleoside-triphosphatase THEP1
VKIQLPMNQTPRSSQPAIILLTGERKAGKSTLCLDIYRHLKSKGIKVTGLVTEQPAPHTLISTALPSGKRYTLTLPFDSDRGIPFSHFRLNPHAMEDSTQSLHASFPTEVFVLDELGPLELVQGGGWIDILTLLRTEQYTTALVVVRPTLLDEAVHQLPEDIFTIVYLTKEKRDFLRERLLASIHALLETPPRHQHKVR